jgi:N-acetylgalactosamine-N,N'-diacetylbacillosaminyl-diphospho-undecaprenol 4-alpha-N-acetylgalactosaminyltransferase
MSKNISILILSLAGGGGEREAAILTNYFHKKYNTKLVLFNKTIKYDLEEDVSIDMIDNMKLYKRTPLNFIKLPLLAYRYAKFCKKNNIETSLSFLPRPNWVAVMSKWFGNKAKIILCEVSTPSQKYNKKKIGGRISLSLMKWLYPKGDLVIANSKGTALEMKEMFKVKNVDCIYNPVELDVITEKKNLEPATTLEYDLFTFIKVARFQYPKDFTTLLTAFANMKNKKCQLVLLGIGEDLENATKLATGLEISDRVKFVGFDRNPFAYLSRSHCFVFSSLYEGFPNSMQEALACGLPVVSTDCTNGPREMLAPNIDIKKDLFAEENIYVGEAGILVPLQNPEALQKAMDLMVKDKQLYNKLRNNTDEIVSKFARDSIVQDFEQFI